MELTKMSLESIKMISIQPRRQRNAPFTGLSQWFNISLMYLLRCTHSDKPRTIVIRYSQWCCRYDRYTTRVLMAYRGNMNDVIIIMLHNDCGMGPSL